jgi:hypothetical protein
MLTPITPTNIQPQAISINEIAWMGDSTNWRNEWIEIKNNTSRSINLENWTLTIGDKKTNLSGRINPNDFFLIGKNTKTPNDSLLKGSLNNNGTLLTLSDPSNRIVEKLDFSSGWPAGDNETKRTLEKSTDNGWQTSLNVGGTPKKENSNPRPNVKNISDIEIDEGRNSYSNNFNRTFLRGLAIAFFITIISLYLSLRIKKYSAKN